MSPYIKIIKMTNNRNASKLKETKFVGLNFPMREIGLKKKS
jgi:hypothetical protein